MRPLLANSHVYRGTGETGNGEGGAQLPNILTEERSQVMSLGHEASQAAANPSAPSPHPNSLFQILVVYLAERYRLV